MDDFLRCKLTYSCQCSARKREEERLQCHSIGSIWFVLCWTWENITACDEILIWTIRVALIDSVLSANPRSQHFLNGQLFPNSCPCWCLTWSGADSPRLQNQTINPKSRRQNQSCIEILIQPTWSCFLEQKLEDRMNGKLAHRLSHRS